jgi:tetratricopeptide (TPR) repeat protein
MTLMRTRLILYALVVIAQPLWSSQGHSVRISGVEEPPELTGDPKKLPQLGEAERQFAEVIKNVDPKDAQKLKAVIESLNKLIQQNPDYSYPHYFRVITALCLMGDKGYDRLLKDLDAAIATRSSPKHKFVEDDLANHYSLRAKIKFDMGHYREATDDLDTAIKMDVGSAHNIFNVEGVRPETKSSSCAWNKTDIDALVARFPKDYRVYLYRGLYLNCFVIFEEGYYQQAIKEFQRASELNERSALPHYFIGHLYTRSSMWTKAAARSDDAKNEAHKNAIQEYSKAIELDSKFVPAYELRAMSYLELKQSRQAIKDYDKIAELDPESNIYNDRGLAKMDVGDYYSAIADFDTALEKKKPDDSTLGSTYENRADAYMKMNDCKSAIADIGKAIERHLANDSFLMSIRQFRAIYPEYNTVSNEAICRKIQVLFWPQFSYEVISKQLLKENKDYTPSFLLADLYMKRGDAYLKLGNIRRATTECSRALTAFGDYGKSLDRWRSFGSSPNSQHYIDVKTVEFSNHGAKAWLKTVAKENNYVVQQIEVDCHAKRINTTATLRHDSAGNVISQAGTTGWEQIVPDTKGESLYDGLCSTCSTGSSR